MTDSRGYSSMLILVTLSISLFIWLFVGLSLMKQYRYATSIFDMLPGYPILILSTWIISSVIIYVSLRTIEAFTLILGSGAVSLTILYYLVEWVRDYRLANYKRFLEGLQSELFDIRVIDDYIAETLSQNKVNVFIRHDVDISLKRTLRMAEVERGLGIHSTYLFRMYAERYSFEEAIPIIRKLAEWGFDTGLHYETLSKMSGDKDRALQLFEENIRDIRKIAPVNIVAAHGQRNYKNREIWKDIDKDALHIKSLYDMDSDMYISDAGGKRLTSKKEKVLFGRVYEAKAGDVVQFLIHPDWWY